MTVRAQGKTRRVNSLALVSAGALLAAAAVACGPSYFEIPIETPIRPKMDVSPFQRVLVAGFITGGSDDVDTNLETVRLLRSQLRTKSSLKVIDADVMPLTEIAQDQSKSADDNAAASAAQPAAGTSSGGSAAADAMALPTTIKEEKDLEPYERLFANTAYWKTIGEEYQNPLIVTAENVQRDRAARPGNLRQLRPARDRADTHVHGTQRVSPSAEVRLHRRPNRNDDVFGTVSRRDSLQRAAEHAGAVVLLRADGPAGPELPQCPQRPEDPRHPRSPQLVSTPTRRIVRLKPAARTGGSWAR